LALHIPGSLIVVFSVLASALAAEQVGPRCQGVGEHELPSLPNVLSRAVDHLVNDPILYHVAVDDCPQYLRARFDPNVDGLISVAACVVIDAGPVDAPEGGARSSAGSLSSTRWPRNSTVMTCCM
jgi:hypothetical protein